MLAPSRIYKSRVTLREQSDPATAILQSRFRLSPFERFIYDASAHTYVRLSPSSAFAFSLSSLWLGSSFAGRIDPLGSGFTDRGRAGGRVEGGGFGLELWRISLKDFRRAGDAAGPPDAAATTTTTTT
jgi:hypothetical protein